MKEEIRVLLSFIPLKAQSRFKALLAGKLSLKVVDARGKPWVFTQGWDSITVREEEVPVKKHIYYYLTECKHYLSDNMYEYGDNIIFLENKGCHGHLHTKATILTSKRGLIRS
tara:strand:- start:258 stop:596 length:339 start_codon:yes stop_codon:yes gene_type:complete